MKLFSNLAPAAAIAAILAFVSPEAKADPNDHIHLEAPITVRLLKTMDMDGNNTVVAETTENIYSGEGTAVVSYGSAKLVGVLLPTVDESAEIIWFRLINVHTGIFYRITGDTILTDLDGDLFVPLGTHPRGTEFAVVPQKNLELHASPIQPIQQ